MTSRVSAIPALLVGALAVITVALFALAWAAGRRSRSSGRGVLALAVGFFGAAVMCVVLVASAFRHYGGHTNENYEYACDAWWVEVGTPNGVPDQGGPPTPVCRRAAVDAVPGAILEAVVAGAIAAVLELGVLVVRRRRFDAQLRELAG